MTADEHAAAVERAQPLLNALADVPEEYRTESERHLLALAAALTGTRIKLDEVLRQLATKAGAEEAWGKAEVLLKTAGQRAERLQAELEAAEKACNICGKPWPEHYPSCAYLGNVADRDRYFELAERLQAQLAAARLALDNISRMRDSSAASHARAVLAASEAPEEETPPT